MSKNAHMLVLSLRACNRALSFVVTAARTPSTAAELVDSQCAHFHEGTGRLSFVSYLAWRRIAPDLFRLGTMRIWNPPSRVQIEPGQSQTHTRCDKSQGSEQLGFHLEWPQGTKFAGKIRLKCKIG